MTPIKRNDGLVGREDEILTARRPLRVPGPRDTFPLARNRSVALVTAATAPLLETAVNDWLHDVASQPEKRLVEIDWRTDGASSWTAFILYAE